MAGSRVTQEAPKQPPSRPANRSGYNPGAGSQSGTFASGFNNFLATGRVSLAWPWQFATASTASTYRDFWAF